MWIENIPLENVAKGQHHACGDLGLLVCLRRLAPARQLQHAHGAVRRRGALRCSVHRLSRLSRGC
jgi:hypothetical protein